MADCLEAVARGRLAVDHDRVGTSGLEAVVEGLHSGEIHGGVVTVFGEVRLRGRDGRPDVRLSRRVRGLITEAEVRRDCNGEQDPDDHDDDEELDEGETTLTCEPGPPL